MMIPMIFDFHSNRMGRIDPEDIQVDPLEERIYYSKLPIASKNSSSLPAVAIVVWVHIIISHLTRYSHSHTGTGTAIQPPKLVPCTSFLPRQTIPSSSDAAPPVHHS